MDITAFRESFPEFINTEIYPDAMVEFWAGLGESLLNKIRWGSLYDQGMFLFTAHNLVMARQNREMGEASKIPGSQSGIIASKGIGGVNVSYSAQQMTFHDAGNYNMTTYGRAFWQLVLIVGMGGAQV